MVVDINKSLELNPVIGKAIKLGIVAFGNVKQAEEGYYCIGASKLRSASQLRRSQKHSIPDKLCIYFLGARGSNVHLQLVVVTLSLKY